MSVVTFLRRTIRRIFSGSFGRIGTVLLLILFLDLFFDTNLLGILLPNNKTNAAAERLPLRGGGSSLSSTAKVSSPSFNVIVTTAGRSTLLKTLESIASQLHSRDHLTVISDKEHETVHQIATERITCACTVNHIPNPEPLGFWGHGSRTRWQNELPGDYHMNADDDDIYDPRAMEIIRSTIGGSFEPHLYVFRMIRRWDGVVGLIPPRGLQEVVIKQIGTPCGVYRKIPNLPPWHGNYGGDGKFYLELANRVPVTFSEEVIYQVGQEEDLLSVKDSVS